MGMAHLWVTNIIVKISIAIKSVWVTFVSRPMVDLAHQRVRYKCLTNIPKLCKCSNVSGLMMGQTNL